MVFDGDDDWALSHEAWEFVLAADDKIIDDFGEDLEALRSGSRAFKDTSMFQELPALHVGRYAAEFAEAVLAATKAVAAKLLRAHTEGWYPTDALLGPVAEELAMEAILLAADVKAHLLVDAGALSPSRRARLNEEIEMLREVSFRDRDFEFLFDQMEDGAVEDPDLRAQMGFVNLRFADWFSLFWQDSPLSAPMEVPGKDVERRTPGPAAA